ncbi:cation channel sperm-associated auxiliary subunit delta-like [Oncorhynchus nerka]|uniref:cation channel sperm-associated auxiliary subunit delta-like n=1 Tax=Oncorhynchus nerka TaxID=8023 RepID=UPI0011314D73|nr:cation channel sperm-associated protein subunit delta-like isoform X1 [Oncorhynchus nerka]
MWRTHAQTIFIIMSFLPFCTNEEASPGFPWSSTPKQDVERQDQSIQAPSATFLYSAKKRPVLVRSHCDNRLALYMGKWILITRALFEESATPLEYKGAGKLQGSVSSAAFVLDNLAIVIDGKLYLYSLTKGTWTPAQGVKSMVSTVSALQCCFSKDKACMDVSSCVLLYNLGSALDDQQVYMSSNGGNSFFNLPMAPKATEFIIGVFNMPTVSSIVAMLADNQRKFSFRHISGNRSVQTDNHPMRDPLSSIHVIQPAGMRGHLIIWSPHMLLYSPNHGIVIVPVYIMGEENATLPPPKVTILQVATDDNGAMAVLTSDGVLYYGRAGLEATTVRFASVIDLSKDNLMLFSDYGDLMMIQAREDLLLIGVDFDHKVIIVQQELTRTTPPVQSCPVEQFHSTFAGELFYIDMGSTVHLSAVYIPSPLCKFFPLVTVTESKLLSLEEKCVEDGITTEGTKKYRLDIELKQLFFMEAADGTLKPSSSLRKGSLSTVAVDLMGRNVSCKDFNPLKAHILIGCPPGKHTRVLKDITTCTKGTFTQEQLQDNFSYVIPKAVYDPQHLFRPGSASSDLHISYSITDYFCPLLVYHDTPWIPSLELWNGNEFVEQVSADFVMFEVNGMYNYQYLQSVEDAKCVSQPQNWTSLLSQQKYQPNPNTAWTRNNYKSCKDSDGPPLTDPEAQYQVLNMGTRNRVLFPNYNGMYVFRVIVVDPSYSYCMLTTTFSVYVYGAFPPHPLPSCVALGIFLAIFVVLLLIGFFLSKRNYKK